LARAPKIAPNRDRLHPLDLQYGLDTGGYIPPEALRSGSPHDTRNNGYSAVAPSVFREACHRWRESLPASARVESYTFVDVGAGKGRALLLASELAFRKIIGVELNPELARIAERNIETWKRRVHPRARIHIRGEDALKFCWPQPPLVVYLNNPFECDLVEQLVEKLVVAAASGPPLVDVLYVNPGCASAFTRNIAFEELWNSEIRMDRGDEEADPYGAASDRVAAFRFRAAGRSALQDGK
jgi:SAM-dependent methyltransferase